MPRRGDAKKVETWFTPWRYPYLISPRTEVDCVFCEIRSAREDRENLVLLRGRDNYVVLNRYPYNNGHLMIVPNRHGAFLEDHDPATRTEMFELAARCETALRSAYHPDGLNMGLNLGRGAGAGIAGHLHLHVLPRWGGDTNFMTVVGETRIVPEGLDDTYARLFPLVNPMSPDGKTS